MLSDTSIQVLMKMLAVWNFSTPDISFLLESEVDMVLHGLGLNLLINLYFRTTTVHLPCMCLVFPFDVKWELFGIQIKVQRNLTKFKSYLNTFVKLKPCTFELCCFSFYIPWIIDLYWPKTAKETHSKSIVEFLKCTGVSREISPFLPKVPEDLTSWRDF